ncbi:hypothetical protein G6F63_015326 [Rhizopus arrhizus]|nr:hypothetical protein G6F63_015326 [Rhizopus arrhizus]
MKRAATRCLLPMMPNSNACLMLLMVSPLPLARPITCALEACACNRNDEKSELAMGWRTLPTTWPPLAFTTAIASRSSEWPNA